MLTEGVVRLGGSDSHPEYLPITGQHESPTSVRLDCNGRELRKWYKSSRIIDLPENERNAFLLTVTEAVDLGNSGEALNRVSLAAGRNGACRGAARGRGAVGCSAGRTVSPGTGPLRGGVRAAD